MDSSWRSRLAWMAAALWWGSLTAVGAWVVPLLFAYLPTPSLAGQMAARLFSAQTWVALACGLLLLMLIRPRDAAQVDASAQRSLGWVVAGMVLALVLEFGVAPRILAREDLRLWHAVGSALFVLQWVCAGAALWRQGRALRSETAPDPQV